MMNEEEEEEEEEEQMDTTIFYEGKNQLVKSILLLQRLKPFI